MMFKETIKKSLLKTATSLWSVSPLIIGMILLISLFNTVIPKELVSKLFGKGVLDPLIGGAIGSIMTWNPITSYILGGELLNSGVSLLAVTAMILSWVTVGIIQFPAEASLLGKKFALTRNISAFVLSIIASFIVVFLVGVL